MKRGGLVAVALHSRYGKPYPALVIQPSLFDENPSVTTLPVAVELHDTPMFRLAEPTSVKSRLRKPSQVMVDKPQTASREKTGETFGRFDDDAMFASNRALAVFPGFA